MAPASGADLAVTGTEAASKLDGHDRRRSLRGHQLISEFVTTPIIERVTGERPDLSELRPLVGNLPLAIGMLVLVWTLAAFGEELAYRAYVLERAATLGGRLPAAYAGAVVVSSCSVLSISIKASPEWRIRRCPASSLACSI